MGEKGFTLIELVIVFSIIALLSLIGIANFVAFTQRQVLLGAISDLRTLFNVARVDTLSQINTACTSSEKFGGYTVVVCCRTTGDPTNPINQSPTSYCPTIGCSGTNDYEMYESCINSSGTIRYSLIQGKTIPKQIVISSQTTARTFQFTPITGLVSFGGSSGASGTVVMYSYANQSVTQSTSVSSVGGIQ